jgi:hypothetical protein
MMMQETSSEVPSTDLNIFVGIGVKNKPTFQEKQIEIRCENQENTKF